MSDSAATTNVTGAFCTLRPRYVWFTDAQGRIRCGLPAALWGRLRGPFVLQ